MALCPGRYTRRGTKRSAKQKIAKKVLCPRVKLATTLRTIFPARLDNYKKSEKCILLSLVIRHKNKRAKGIRMEETGLHMFSLGTDLQTGVYCHVRLLFLYYYKLQFNIQIMFETSRLPLTNYKI